MKPLIYPLLLFCFLFVSCQSDSKSTQIEDKKTTFANFYLRYLQAEKKVKAEAFFRKGESAKVGSAVEYKNGVRFDGGAMQMKSVVGRKLYKSERLTDFNSTYTFEVDPGNANGYSHALKINPISNYSLENGVSKSKGIQLKWEGSPLSQAEQLVLLFTDSQNRAFNINIDGPTEHSAASIPKERLEKMKYGNGSLYLVRKFNSISKTEGKQINAASEFYTNAINIKVVE